MPQPGDRQDLNGGICAVKNTPAGKIYCLHAMFNEAFNGSVFRRFRFRRTRGIRKLILLFTRIHLTRVWLLRLPYKRPNKRPAVILWETKMVSKIARTSEYMTVTVVVLLGLACLVSACSSTPPETTGSIARAQAEPAYVPPPVVQPASSVPAYQPAYQPAYNPAYRPAYRTATYTRRQPVCTCNTPRRYDRDITASIPRSTPVASTRPQGNITFVAHVIGPRESMSSISRLYRTRTADIAAVNRITPNATLHSGEILVVPVLR
jgi:hypothetical protein